MPKRQTQLKAFAATTCHPRSPKPTQSICCNNSKCRNGKPNSKHSLQQLVIPEAPNQPNTSAATTPNAETANPTQSIRCNNLSSPKPQINSIHLLQQFQT